MGAFAPGRTLSSAKMADAVHNTWKMRVTSAVSRRDAQGRRVPAMPGDYRVTALDADNFEFKLPGAPTFGLSLQEINRFISERALRPLTQFP
jgi:hypothetical protein